MIEQKDTNNQFVKLDISMPKTLLNLHRAE